jgi:hypothetical protein
MVRPTLGHALKDAPSLIAADAGEHHLDHAPSITRPLSTPVGIDRIVGFFVGPVALIGHNADLCAD